MLNNIVNTSEFIKVLNNQNISFIIKVPNSNVLDFSHFPSWYYVHVPLSVLPLSCLLYLSAYNIDYAKIIVPPPCCFLAGAMVNLSNRTKGLCINIQGAPAEALICEFCFSSINM